MELVNQLAGIAIDLAVVLLAWENLQKVSDLEGKLADSEASRLY